MKTLATLVLGSLLSGCANETQPVHKYKVISFEVKDTDTRRELWTKIEKGNGIIGALYTFDWGARPYEQMNLYTGPPSKTYPPEIVMYDLNRDGLLDGFSDPKSRFNFTDILGKFRVEQQLFDAYKKVIKVDDYRPKQMSR